MVSGTPQALDLRMWQAAALQVSLLQLRRETSIARLFPHPHASSPRSSLCLGSSAKMTGTTEFLHENETNLYRMKSKLKNMIVLRLSMQFIRLQIFNKVPTTKIQGLKHYGMRGFRVSHFAFLFVFTCEESVLVKFVQHAK